MPSVTRKVAVGANQVVHTAVSHVYNQSPHFRPENQLKVDLLIQRLATQAKKADPAPKLLDMGCGTGFILHIAAKYFAEIHGVDVTEAMLKQVDLKRGNIKTHLCEAEDTPFDDAYFDVVTAYTFMDHLSDINPFFEEVHRVLKPGGVFFSDLNPSREYWSYLFELSEKKTQSVSSIVEREISNVVFNDKLLSEQTGLDPKIIADCETTKSTGKGFSRTELEALTKRIGFSKVEFELHWFMGEAQVLHGDSAATAEKIDQHLRAISPASDHLFKYLRMYVTK